MYNNTIKYFFECTVAHFVNGKLSGHNSGVTVGKTDTINCLEPGQVYKYLGVDKRNGIQHSTMRETPCREYIRSEDGSLDRVCTVGTKFWPSLLRVCTAGSHLRF